MTSLCTPIARAAVGTASVLALAIATVLMPAVLDNQPSPQPQARPCYPGVIPGNPWATSCNFGPRQPKVRGGAPDQTAVIACRDIPGCLSAYVNGPW